MEEDFAAKWKREGEERAKANHVERQQLFKELRAAGVTLVTVSYNGSGDSGDVEATVLEGGGDGAKAFEERCSDAAMAALEDKHSGWEINEGAFGNVVFDITKGKVRLEHNHRVESSEYEGSEENVDGSCPRGTKKKKK